MKIVFCWPTTRHSLIRSIPLHSICPCKIINYSYWLSCDMCEWMSWEVSPRHPESFNRKYVAITEENMLLLLLLKIKGSVTLLSQVQVIIPKEYRHSVFVECAMIIMEPAGSLEFLCARTFASLMMIIKVYLHILYMQRIDNFITLEKICIFSSIESLILIFRSFYSYNYLNRTTRNNCNVISLIFTFLFSLQEYWKYYFINITMIIVKILLFYTCKIITMCFMYAHIYNVSLKKYPSRP